MAEGYHRLAEEAVTPWLVVDGTGPVEEVAAAVWSGVEGRLAAAPEAPAWRAAVADSPEPDGGARR